MAFEVMTTPGRLYVDGKIGHCCWEREVDMLAWFQAAGDDLRYLVARVPSCIQTRAFSKSLATKHVAERLALIRKEKSLRLAKNVEQYLSVETEQDYCATMTSELSCDDPPSCREFTTEFLFCVAAVRWFLRYRSIPERNA